MHEYIIDNYIYLRIVSIFSSNTVYLEIFARRNFRELPAELNFRVFIFANGDLTIYIVYIANDLY